MRIPFVALCIILIVSISKNTFGQDSSGKKRIETVHSDFARMLTTDSSQVNVLWGNVLMKHNEVLLSCDSAVLLPNDLFKAFGNAKVTSSETVVTGDEMTYNGSTNMADVRGRIVYLTNGSSTLRTTKIEFDTNSEIGYFENEGTIVDSTHLIESKRGYFYSGTKEFKFIGTVQADTKEHLLQSDSMTYNTNSKIFTFHFNTHIWSNNGYLYCDKGWYNSENGVLFFLRNSYMLSSKQEIFADSIYFDNNAQKGKLFSNIQIADTAQKTIALSDYAKFDLDTEDFRMEKNPSIIIYDENNDSTFIRADTIYSLTFEFPVDSVATNTKPTTDSISFAADSTSVINMNFADSTSIVVDSVAVDSVRTYKELHAYKNVKLYRSDFQLICDSLFFNDIDSIWKIHYNPIIWDGKKMQITSDSMKIFIENSTLREAQFQNNAMIVMPEGEPDTTIYFNQIKGRNINAYFRNGKINVMETLGNVQTIVFSLPEMTMNSAQSASMKMEYYPSGSIRKIGYYTNPDIKNNPLFSVKENEIQLQGFKWEINLRPKSGEEILNRPLRATERETKENILKPDFPITKRIDDIENSLGLKKDSEDEIYTE